MWLWETWGNVSGITKYSSRFSLSLSFVALVSQLVEKRKDSTERYQKLRREHVAIVSSLIARKKIKVKSPGSRVTEQPAVV